jgi:hypothetical protein
MQRRSHCVLRLVGIVILLGILVGTNTIVANHLVDGGGEALLWLSSVVILASIPSLFFGTCVGFVFVSLVVVSFASSFFKGNILALWQLSWVVFFSIGAWSMLFVNSP